ncbi:MAG: hypothetical protein NVSMB31_18250 [Vulcanimicrobiaceae bacterium]
MSLSLNRALSLLVLAGTLGATASQARAEGAYKGTFNLPVEARWGSAVLSPGQYTISIPQGDSFHNVISLRGKGNTINILAGAFERNATRSHGQLTLLDVDGKYVVSEFEAGTLGKSFKIPLSKEIRNALRHGDVPKTSVIGIGD